jgi:hypothetical protein
MDGGSGCSVDYGAGKWGCWGFKQGSIFANWKKRWFVMEFGTVIKSSSLPNLTPHLTISTGGGSKHGQIL